VNQADLRLLAEERVKDAEVLLKGQRWPFAYYTAGYAVECALKSCLLARMIHTGWVFQERWQAKDCMTHDFEALIDLADMRAQLNGMLAASVNFRTHWTRARLWDVSVRYVLKSQTEAEELFEAVNHNPDGILTWLRNYW
jgi:HEPN domain-containing protein